MTQVEIVGLWVGLIGSIVGIVLSIVAIVFSILVNNRSDKVSANTIQSLQKIESTVEGLSDATTNLIKVAWDKMLGNVGQVGETGLPVSSAKEIASGLAAELRVQLASENSGTPDSKIPPEQIERLENMIEEIQKTLLLQLKSQQHPERISEIFTRVLTAVSSMSIEAQELARIISNGRSHLTRMQYVSLKHNQSTRKAIEELRDSGLIVPLEAAGGKKEPVYYFPPDIHNIIKPALNMLPKTNNDVKSLYESTLKNIGYKVN